MIAGKPRFSVLVVSASDKVYSSILGLLSPGDYHPVMRAKNSGEAKRMLLSASADIVIINTPLPDDFGIQLAVDISDQCAGVLMLVKSDLYEQISYRVEDNGVFTLPKPNSLQTIYSAIKLLSVFTMRLKKMENKTRSMQEKMADIRAVNRAKWLLIDNLNMSESDAHYYIEKQAMDARIPRREVAENIIRTYDN